ncbi:MAG TPA: hypothetical protein VGM93_00910, partial [Acidimicrobiales bacterium]
MTEPRTMVIVAFEGCNLLDLAGPVEVFRAASDLGADPGYRLVVATPGGHSVASSSGVPVGGGESVGAWARKRSPIDSLVVIG